MKALVTGGTGFIGGRLVNELFKNGYEVRCLVRDTSDVKALVELGSELVYGDLGNDESLRKLPHGCDLVFHLAAHVSDWGERQVFYRYNVDATRTLLESSLEADVKRFIHMSTTGIVHNYDFWSVHDIEDIDENYPYKNKYNDYYKESKAEAEKLVLRFSKETGLDTVVIRPSAVWGAGDTVILPRLVMAAKKGLLFPIGSGATTVTPCHVDNLARAMLLAAVNEQAPGNIYFINDGIKISIMDFMKKGLEACSIDWNPSFTIPYKFAYAVAALLEFIYRVRNSEKPPVLTRTAVSGLAGSWCYSIEKARRELGYEPYVDLEEGMAKMQDWVNLLGGTEALMKY